MAARRKSGILLSQQTWKGFLWVGHISPASHERVKNSKELQETCTQQENMFHVVAAGSLRVSRETVIVYVFISNPFPPKHVVCNLTALKCIPWSTHLSTSVPLSNCQFKHRNYKMKNNRDKNHHSQLGQYQTGYATEHYEMTNPTRIYFNP
jgi:hypothetical protein